MKELTNKINKVQSELTNLNSYSTFLKTPVNIVCQYIELHNNLKYSVNKKRKEIDKRLEEIKDQYKFINNDQPVVIKYEEKRMELDHITNQIKYVENDIQKNIQVIIEILKNQQFMEENSDSTVGLTLLGKIATNIREVHCLVFSRLIEDLKNMNSRQLISVFSCFTNITVSEDLKSNTFKMDDKNVSMVLLQIKNMYDEYQFLETEKMLDTGTDYHYHYDLLKYVEMWCDCQNVEDCKFLLQTMEKEKEIFLGEFVKALLKINNISAEMEKIAEFLGDINFLKNLKEIPSLTLKYVVTNQSLYI